MKAFGEDVQAVTETTGLEKAIRMILQKQQGK